MKTKSEILNLIKSIGLRGRRLDNDVQEAAVAGIFYSVCHGDSTIADRLLETVSLGTRKVALVAFLEHYGQLRHDTKSKKMVYQRVDSLFDLYHENKDASEEYCAGIKTHWTGFKPETVTSKYDCLESVTKLIKKMEREIQNQNALNSDVYDVIAKAFNEYKEQQEEQEEPEEILNPVLPEGLKAVA